MSWEVGTVPARDPEIAWREVGDEIYVFGGDGETVHTLSSVAADIWRACDGRNSVGDIAELIVATYDVDQRTAAADLLECLAALEEKGLVRAS